MNRIVFDNAFLSLTSDDLPVVVHGKEGSGASFFSVMLAAALSRSNDVLFWSAYQMAKDELRKELAGEEARVNIIDSGDPTELEKVVPRMDSGSILFIKNFETIPQIIREQLLVRRSLVISGDMENVLSLAALRLFTTKIFFSPYHDLDLPQLAKYQGHIRSSRYEGIAQVIQ